MTSFQTLYRRTAAILSAIAALTATGLATAQQTVTLSGASSNTCSYSGQMLVRPDGSLEITCSSSTATAKFALTAPTSLTTNNANTGTDVKVTRSGTNVGDASVAFATSGPCTALTSSPLLFADGVAGFQPIELSTGATSGNCVVSITSTSLGTLTSPLSRTLKVSDPDANVTFAFSNPTSTSTVGGAPVTITVTRTGGINGTYSIPFTLSGTLGSTADDGSSSNGELSGTLLFTGSTNNTTPGNQTDTLTYAPPTSAVGTPANLIISLGTPSPPSIGSQVADPGTPHTLTLNSAPVGCPVPETNAALLPSPGTTDALKLSNGSIQTYVLPTPTGTFATGIFKLSETTISSPLTPWSYEIHINKCKGLVQASTTDKCYSKSSNMTLHTKVWFTKTTTSTAFNTPAKIAAAGYCYAPTSEGPWYVNVRYNYTGCKASGGICGWGRAWSNWIY